MSNNEDGAYLYHQKILNDMFSNESTYRLLKHFCYFSLGYIRVGHFAELKLPNLRCFYSEMIEKIETDENAFLKEQARWLGYSEKKIREFIQGETGKKFEDNKIKLEEELNKLLDGGETVAFSSDENKNELKRNSVIKNLLRFFFDKAEEIEDKEKRAESIAKNDRALKPEDFNCCMEVAQLNYEMIKEDKKFVIKRK